MGFMDKFKNSAQKAMGRAKAKTGEFTDDKKLEAEGRKDQASGGVKQAAEQVKDAGKSALGD